MSDKRSTSTAGLIGGAIAAGAIVGAACYAAYEFFNSNGWFDGRGPMPPAAPACDATHQPINEETETSLCSICERDIASEESIQLTCDHWFHKICLQANYILHMDEPRRYKCPTCHDPVPDFVITSLCN